MKVLVIFVVRFSNTGLHRNNLFQISYLPCTRSASGVYVIELVSIYVYKFRYTVEPTYSEHAYCEFRVITNSGSLPNFRTLESPAL